MARKRGFFAAFGFPHPTLGVVFSRHGRDSIGGAYFSVAQFMSSYPISMGTAQ